jgi:hypothetical protein
MIYYSHTGTIYFAPLSSDKRRKKRETAEETHRSEHPYAPALVSCKSMYRLSEKASLIAPSLRATTQLTYLV